MECYLTIEFFIFLDLSVPVSSGKEFLVVFMENYVERRLANGQLSLVVTSCSRVVGTAEIHSTSASLLNRRVTIYPDQVNLIIIPNELMLKGSEKSRKALRYIYTTVLTDPVVSRLSRKKV